MHPTSDTQSGLWHHLWGSLKVHPCSCKPTARPWATKHTSDQTQATASLLFSHPWMPSLGASPGPACSSVTYSPIVYRRVHLAFRSCSWKHGNQNKQTKKRERKKTPKNILSLLCQWCPLLPSGLHALWHFPAFSTAFRHSLWRDLARQAWNQARQGLLHKDLYNLLLLSVSSCPQMGRAHSSHKVYE